MNKDISQSGASRNTITKHRYDLLVWKFIDKMARVMAEGAEHHGERNWEGGFDDPGRDIDNHIFDHWRLYRDGDRNEYHLAKMAIGLMFKDYFDTEEIKDALQQSTQHRHPFEDYKRQDGGEQRDAAPSFAGDGCEPQGDCNSPEDSITMLTNSGIPVTFGVPSGPEAKTAEELLGPRFADSQVHTGHDKT